MLSTSYNPPHLKIHNKKRAFSLQSAESDEKDITPTSQFSKHAKIGSNIGNIKGIYDTEAMRIFYETERDKVQILRKEIMNTQKSLQSIKTSNMPIEFKVKLLESTSQQLRTKILVMNDLKQKIAEETDNSIKVHEYVEGLSQEQFKKDTSNFSTPNGSISTKFTVKASKENDENIKPPTNQSEQSNTPTQSFLTNQSQQIIIEQNQEDTRLQDELKHEIRVLEENIITKKSVKNCLTLKIEDATDDLQSLFHLEQQKKRHIQKQNDDIKLLKNKIATKSSKKSTMALIKPLNLDKIGNHSNTTSQSHRVSTKPDVDQSRLNTTIFQDVNNKIQNVIDKVFRRKKIENNDKILTTEVLGDYDQGKSKDNFDYNQRPLSARK